MLKILSYGILFIIVGALSVFFAENQGGVTLNWLGYSIETTVPVLVIFGLAVFWLWNFFVLKPLRFLAGRKQHKLDDYAYAEMMNAGMALVLASDISGAKKIERKLIKKIGSAPMLSMAIAVAEKNDANRLACAETLLLEDKTSLFGLKGIIDYYYEHKEYEKALDYATRALKKEPVLWAYRAAVNLKIKNGLFKDALETLDSGKKVIPADEFSSMKLSLLMKLSESDENKEKYLESALKVDAGFTPALLSLAAYYKVKGRENKALKVLKNGFAVKPDILLYDYLAENLADKSNIVKLATELVGDRGNDPLTEQIIGESFARCGIWGQASLHLKNSLKDGELSSRVALILAKTEKELGHEEDVEKWTNAILNAEMSNKWRCSECGHEYPSWQVSCTSCGAFGTVKWDTGKKTGSEIMVL